MTFYYWAFGRYGMGESDPRVYRDNGFVGFKLIVGNPIVIAEQTTIAGQYWPLLWALIKKLPFAVKASL